LGFGNVIFIGNFTLEKIQKLLYSNQPITFQNSNISPGFILSLLNLNENRRRFIVNNLQMNLSMDFNIQKEIGRHFYFLFTMGLWSPEFKETCQMNLLKELRKVESPADLLITSLLPKTADLLARTNQEDRLKILLVTLLNFFPTGRRLQPMDDPEKRLQPLDNGIRNHLQGFNKEVIYFLLKELNPTTGQYIQRIRSDIFGKNQLAIVNPREDFSPLKVRPIFEALSGHCSHFLEFPELVYIKILYSLQLEQYPLFSSGSFKAHVFDCVMETVIFLFFSFLFFSFLFFSFLFFSFRHSFYFI